MKVTVVEKVLIDFLRYYNGVLESQEVDKVYSYKVYLDMIKNTEEEEVNCIVFELIRKEGKGKEEVSTIIYEEYTPLGNRTYTFMKNGIIGHFITRSLSTMIGALESIEEMKKKDGQGIQLPNSK